RWLPRLLSLRAHTRPPTHLEPRLCQLRSLELRLGLAPVRARLLRLRTGPPTIHLRPSAQTFPVSQRCKHLFRLTRRPCLRSRLVMSRPKSIRQRSSPISRAHLTTDLRLLAQPCPHRQLHKLTSRP